MTNLQIPEVLGLPKEERYSPLRELKDVTHTQERLIVWLWLLEVPSQKEWNINLFNRYKIYLVPLK